MTPSLAEAIDLRAQSIHETWGSSDELAGLAPSKLHDPTFRTWFSTYYLRLSASPEAVIALDHMNAAIDGRHLLPANRVPTLVLNRSGADDLIIQTGRYVARISGARLVELAGDESMTFAGDIDALVDEIEASVTGTRPAATPCACCRAHWRREAISSCRTWSCNWP